MNGCNNAVLRECVGLDYDTATITTCQVVNEALGKGLRSPGPVHVSILRSIVDHFAGTVLRRFKKGGVSEGRLDRETLQYLILDAQKPDRPSLRARYFR